jgi:hypothetical protein
MSSVNHNNFVVFNSVLKQLIYLVNALPSLTIDRALIIISITIIKSIY